MFKKILIFNVLIITVLLVLTACQPHEKRKTIGIIVPIEHKAFNEIIAGFSEALKKSAKEPVIIKVANAQGDLNIQQSIVQQMKGDTYDMVVPVGTAATEMSAKFITNKPIVSLASVYSEQDRKTLKNCNIAVVHDEIAPAKLIQFIHDVYPKMTQITLIHSTDDKVYQEMKALTVAGDQLGIHINSMLVPSLNELYSISRSLPKDTQAILILKDSLMASGISTLVQTAHKQQIPLITADEGTVAEGADFALGVREKQIGESGAQLALKILEGQKACDLAIQEIESLHVFVNATHLAHQTALLKAITSAAEKHHYQIDPLQGAQ